MEVQYRNTAVIFDSVHLQSIHLYQWRSTVCASVRSALRICVSFNNSIVIMRQVAGQV